MLKEKEIGTFQLAGVDLLKLIMAFCVMLVHLKSVFFKEDNNFFPPVVEWFLRLSVPFFFTASGYLLQRKLSSLQRKEKVNYLKYRIKKIIKIFLYWLAIYFPIALYSYISGDVDFHNAVKDYLFQLITRGESLYAWPLWYLYSLIFVFSLICVTGARKNYLAVLGVLFSIVVFLNNIYLKNEESFLQYFYLYTDRTLGGGLPVILGMFIYRMKSVPSPLILSGASFALSLLLYLYEMPYWECVGGASLFIAGMMLPIKSGPSYLTMRQKSMWIYYIHMYVLFLMSRVLKAFDFTVPPAELIAMAFTITYITATLLVHAERIKGLRQIRILIS